MTNIWLQPSSAFFTFTFISSSVSFDLRVWLVCFWASLTCFNIFTFRSSASRWKNWIKFTMFRSETWNPLKSFHDQQLGSFLNFSIHLLFIIFINSLFQSAPELFFCIPHISILSSENKVQWNGVLNCFSFCELLFFRSWLNEALNRI